MMTSERPALPAPISSAHVISDVQLALDLARGRATGEAADVLRTRLRTYITAFVDPAQAYAEGLDDSRARDIALNTVRHARAVADDAVGDPAASLRLLAKAAEHTARYAAGHWHAARRQPPRGTRDFPPSEGWENHRPHHGRSDPVRSETGRRWP